MGNHSRQRVAIIGAGLAGLSAAYQLRDKANVTIFERDDRLGGRVFASEKPPGEHGAESLLESECELSDLLAELGIATTSCLTEPWYFFRGLYATGAPDKAGEHLLPPESANRIAKLFKLVRQEQWPKTTKRFVRWLSSFLEGDKEAMRFVGMLLAGETCAPLHHLSTRYSLESLSSLSNDEWYRIKGGSTRLAKELFRQSTACLHTSAHVSRVEPIRGGIEIRWREGGARKSEIFQVTIIATPDGERLLGKPVPGHFHGYVNVLLGYRSWPQVKGRPDLDLKNGLITDGPLNYIKLTAHPRSSYVLRVLIPNAGEKLHWKASDVVAFCVQHLKPIIANADQFCVSSVKAWQQGLPCAGSNKSFQKVGSRVYLAGDRFGQWPSMDAAVASGRGAAKAVGTSSGLRSGGK